MDSATALQLLHNLTLLLVLTIPYRAILRATASRPVEGAMLKGVLFGAVIIVGMAMPLEFGPGLFLDSRSVVASVGALFGGPVTGAVILATAGGCCLSMGGVGAVPGFGVVCTSAVLGVLFYQWRGRRRGLVWVFSLWGFGLLVHVAMLAWMLAFPSAFPSSVLADVGAPVLLALPLGSVLLGVLLAMDERNLERDRHLCEYEQRFRGVFDNGPLAMLMVNLAGRITRVNDAACAMFGMSRAEIVGKLPQTLTHPDDRAATMVLIRDYLAGATPLLRTEKRYISSAGSVLWGKTTVFPIALESGATAYSLAIIEDVTERREAETALRRSEACLALARKAAGIGTWEWDIATGELDWSDEIYQIQGLAPGSQAPRFEDLLARVHPDDRATFLASIQACMKEGADHVLDYRVVWSDGSVHWISAFGGVERDASGNVARLMGIARDITPRKESEAELAQHRDHLEESVAARTQALEVAHKQLLERERLASLGCLTATVSHELRNPLGTIRTTFFSVAEAVRAAGLCLDGPLDRIERNIIRCDRIIEELLDYTRTQAPDRRMIDVDEWLGRVLDELPVVPGVRVERRLTAGVAVALDAERMRRAVVNVFTNAGQAMAEAGDGAHRLLVATEVRGDQLEIRFQDSGVGISADLLNSVFEPFYSTKSFGVGLGLTVVRQTVEAHGGHVRVESTSGAGTLVILEIPLVLDDAEEHGPVVQGDAS